jgi:two-component system, NarL family, nitrate/nitrite response regulator NarL
MKKLLTSRLGLAALTKRRRQVASLVCRGLSNRAIAEKLGLSEGTVKVHLQAIFGKLDLHSRTELTSALADCGKSGRD